VNVRAEAARIVLSMLGVLSMDQIRSIASFISAGAAPSRKPASRIALASSSSLVSVFPGSPFGSSTRALKDRLWGVRLDTSGQLVDRALWNEMGDFDPRGVNERLVRKVREALDRDGFEQVRIVASGGFTVDRIRAFEEAGVPVDAYGVGSSLIRGENDFTGDIVLTDGRATAKVGRRFRSNDRLELVP